MMKTRMRHCLAVSALTAVMAGPAMAANVGVMVGTNGLGVDYTIPVASRLQTRLHASYLKYDIEQTQDDLDYDVTFNNSQLGAILDLHPFAGSFRLSAGLVMSNFGLDLKGSYTNDSVEIGDNTYKGQLQMDGETKFNRVAPYFGLGWASAPTETGFSFNTELGVIMIGEGNLDLTATGQVSDVNNPGVVVNVSNFSQFQEDLEKERQKAEKDIRDFTMFPVINLGVSYAF